MFFCWRHHKNPVGKSWKWQTDSPDFIVNEAIKKHTNAIAQLKGMTGIKESRWLEGVSQPRHCALSLVGEPIMYPHINELIHILHQKHISTFLVTNGQFPECIENLKGVTQLYVSVDAANRKDLKAIDRPLFSDFWERLMKSLENLKKKKFRTVYRLTLVKQFNMQEADEYGKLMLVGEPDFLEIKGVTFCGVSTNSNLSIKNSPWHSEVVEFGNAIIASNPQLEDMYELACEHRHSCCVVFAKKTYKINNEWHTWIDYEKFHELVLSGVEFSGMDYMRQTPKWAVFGSDERGFDPNENRVYTKGKYKRLGYSGLPSCTEMTIQN